MSEYTGRMRRVGVPVALAAAICVGIVRFDSESSGVEAGVQKRRAGMAYLESNPQPSPPIELKGQDLKLPIRLPELSPECQRSARAINRLLGRSGLAGYGELILQAAIYYKVPAQLALAMFWQEANWNTNGLAPRANNPGNLKYVPSADYQRFYGARSGPADAPFEATFPSVAKGIAAYFALLDKYYRRFLAKDDLKGLIYVYAPPSENSTDSYIETAQRNETRWSKLVCREARDAN